MHSGSTGQRWCYSPYNALGLHSGSLHVLAKDGVIVLDNALSVHYGSLLAKGGVIILDNALSVH